MVAALQIPAERRPALNISCNSDAWNGPASVPYTARQKNGCTEPEKWQPNENASKPSPLQQSSQQRLNCLNLAQRITPPFRNLRDPVRNSRHATGHACCRRRTKAATPYRPSRLDRLWLLGRVLNNHFDAAIRLPPGFGIVVGNRHGVAFADRRYAAATNAATSQIISNRVRTALG